MQGIVSQRMKKPTCVYNPTVLVIVGGTVASWLVPATQERMVRVRVLAGDIVLHVLGQATLLT